MVIVLLKVLKLIKRTFVGLLRNIISLPGLITQYKVNRANKSLLFTDQFGFHYWQYPGDNIALNITRKSICDSVGVVKYILNNLRPGSICIDIGASIGGVSVPMWHRVGHLSGLVITVEADPAKKAVIEENLKVNGFPSGYVETMVVSDNQGVASFRYFPEAPGWNTLGDPQYARDRGVESYTVEVETNTISQLLEKYNLRHLTLVKVDTEGAELLILQSMLPLLCSGSVEQVIFEVNPLILPGMNASAEELISLWEGLPYCLYLINDKGDKEALPDIWPSNYVGDCVAIKNNGE